MEPSATIQDYEEAIADLMWINQEEGHTPQILFINDGVWVQLLDVNGLMRFATRRGAIDERYCGMAVIASSELPVEQIWILGDPCQNVVEQVEQPAELKRG